MLHLRFAGDEWEKARRRIVHVVAQKGLIANEVPIITKLMEKEKFMTTAIGNRIPIPRCPTDEVPALVITVACSMQRLTSTLLMGFRFTLWSFFAGRPEMIGPASTHWPGSHGSSGIHRSSTSCSPPSAWSLGEENSRAILRHKSFGFGSEYYLTRMLLLRMIVIIPRCE